MPHFAHPAMRSLPAQELSDTGRLESVLTYREEMARGASQEVATDKTDDEGVTWWLAAIAVFGIPLFFAFIFIIGATRSGYNLMSDEISQLSASGVPGAWAQTANFIVFGVISIGLAVGLHRGLTNGEGSVLGPVLVGAFGLLAAIGNGLFPTDRIGSPETTMGTLHSLTAGIGFLAVISAMFVLARRMRIDDDWSDLAGPSRLIGVSAAILMVLYLIAKENEGFLDGHVGLIQRLFAATVLTWLFLLALRLGRTSGTRSSSRVASG